MYTYKCTYIHISLPLEKLGKHLTAVIVAAAAAAATTAATAAAATADSCNNYVY